MGLEINKVDQTQSSEIKKDDNLSARLMNRSNSNVVIGNKKEQGTVSNTTPPVSEIRTETENSFSKAKTLPEHELNHRLEESFGSQDNNESSIPLAPELPSFLNAKISQLRNNVNHGNISLGDELKQTVKNNKREDNGSSLEELDKSVNEKQMESTKSLFKEEKIISHDKTILSETQYQDKPVHENIKDISNQDIQLFVEEFKSGEKGLRSLVGEIDKTLNKSKVYTKAKEMGKEITTGLDPEMALGIKLRTDTELKEIVANSVAIKDKYHESHNKSLSKYTKGMAQLGPLMVQVEELRTKRCTPEERNLKVELQKQVYDIGKKYDLLNTYPSNKGGEILIEDIKSPPSLYQALPSNKQKLVNSIVEGMKSGIPDQASKEKVKFGKEIGLSTEIEIPESITLNNKTYINPQYLAKGGLGAVFKYVNQDDPNDTVVVKNLLDSTKKDEMVTEIKNHVHALGGQDNNPNVINLKGIVKGNGTELYMVMETAKGDAGDVFYKLRDISSQKEPSISPKTQDLLKTFLSKDMMESMLYLQNDRNMIHLDIKPNNFLMNNEGKAVIADFGTSRRTQDGFNLKFENDNPLASPEALTKSSKDNDEKLLITEKSDIWSLGIALNNINYGESRLEGKFSSHTRNNVIEFSKDDNNRLIENEAFGVDRVINAMTHPDPNQRPTLEAVLKSSLFTDPKLDKPELRELVKELLSENPDDKKIRALSQSIES